MHILHFLRDLGHDAPRSTPPGGRRYLIFERRFLEECDGMGLTPERGDAAVWAAYSGNTSGADVTLIEDMQTIYERLSREE